MTTYIIDTETNGLLKDLTTIHCMVIRCVETDEALTCSDTSDMQVIDGLELLMGKASELASKFVGHNLIGFDIPAITKCYPWFTLPEHKCFDTLVASSKVFLRGYLIDIHWKHGVTDYSVTRVSTQVTPTLRMRRNVKLRSGLC